MHLNHGIHLAYCTNIHRGENWQTTFSTLENYTLKVRDRVSPGAPYAIGLRLGHQAAIELNEAGKLDEFKRWLEKENCYVFTINGFPYGNFHGTRVKEQVYAPDWSTPERLSYTNLLFDIIAQLAPGGVAGSVSTLPGSFKEFIAENDHARVDAMIKNLISCAAHVADLSEKTGKDLHLGLEPEPLGYFENTEETVAFFDRLKAAASGQASLLKHVGVNYDTCHLAIEYEEPAAAIARLRQAGIRISKLHLSSALKLKPTPDALERLAGFQEEVYLHQVIIREHEAEGSPLRRYRDLPDALALTQTQDGNPGDEWRVHFHVPLYNQPEAIFGDTKDHVLGILDLLAADPSLCSHLEMETYTWEVLPKAMHDHSVVDQLEKEYRWTLGEMKSRELV